MTQTCVFLSYARADDDPDYDDASKSFMRRLYRFLEAAGFDVWWDRVSLPSRGEVFTKEIEDAIRPCDRFVLVIGPGAVASDYVRAEWRFALSLCKPITVILRAGEYEIIPSDVKGFSGVNAIDCRPSRDENESLPDLADRLHEDAPIGETYGVDVLPEGFITRDAPYNTARDSLLQDEIQATVVSAAVQTATSVYGPGGVGKSTLATAIGRDCAVRRRFTDGVIWVKVGQKAVPTQLQSAVGVTVYKDSPDNYKTERDGWLALSQILKGKKALIILDDVWEHELVEHLPVANTGCRLLITTRSATLAANIKGLDVRLDVLTPEEGARLIAARVGGGEQPIYLQISQELNGHTLAVVLAAARLKKKGASYAQTILEGLKNTAHPFLHLTVHPQDKNLNLSKSLALSYDALTPEQQKQYRQLGVFAVDSTFPLDGLAGLWGESAASADLQAEALCDACLLDHNPDTGRYSQHRVLCAYARALLDAGELDDAQRRHFAFYEHFHTEGRDVTDPDYLMSITPDLENLREALMWGFTHEPERACNLLTIRLDNYYRTYQTTAYRPLLEAALPAAERIDYQRGQANTLRSLGNLAVREDDLAGARGFYGRALPLYEAIGDRLGQANTLLALGDLAVREADLAGARGFYGRALPIFEGIGDRLGQANTLKALGDLALREDDLAAARGFYGRTLPIYEAIGDSVGLMNTYVNMGRMYRYSGDIEQSKIHFQKWLAIVNTIPAYKDHPVTRNIMREYQALTGEPAPQPSLDDALRQLKPVYDQIGADALREALVGQGLPAEVVEDILARLAAMPSEGAPAPEPQAPNTLPENTVKGLAGNTVAVMTSVREKRNEWRGILVNQRAQWVEKGADYTIEVVFADALLAILDGQPPVIASDNPYAGVVGQVVKFIEDYRPD